MTDITLTTYPNNWAEDSGGIINEGTYIAKNTVTGCRLSVSVGSLGGRSYSLTAGEALSFADGAKVLKAGIQSPEEVATLAVRFMREYPLSTWEGGRKGRLVDENRDLIRRIQK